MIQIRTRELTKSEWADYPTLFANAFLADPDPDPSAARRVHELLEPERFLGAVDGDRLIGGAGILTRAMTLPGAVASPVAAVTYVAVRPDARGRGALSALMRAQLTGLHENGGEPFAALWASMAPIYRRFGYAPASRRATLTVPARAAFHQETPGGGTVRWYDEATSAGHLRGVHASVASGRVGWLSRPEPSWRWWLGDSAEDRGGRTAYRYAVHHARQDGAPDGYAVFRSEPEWPGAGPDYRLDIHELVAATPEAHAELWRSLLDIDLVGRIRHRNVALDDPLPLLLVNPRAVLGEVADALWIRLVDLDRALIARRYSAPCAL